MTKRCLHFASTNSPSLLFPRTNSPSLLFPSPGDRIVYVPLCVPVPLRSGPAPGVICVRLIIRVVTSLAPRPGEERKALKADELA